MAEVEPFTNPTNVVVTASKLGNSAFTYTYGDTDTFANLDTATGGNAARLVSLVAASDVLATDAVTTAAVAHSAAKPVLLARDAKQRGHA